MSSRAVSDGRDNDPSRHPTSKGPVLRAPQPMPLGARRCGDSGRYCLRIWDRARMFVQIRAPCNPNSPAHLGISVADSEPTTAPRAAGGKRGHIRHMCIEVLVLVMSVVSNQAYPPAGAGTEPERKQLAASKACNAQDVLQARAPDAPCQCS